jgi:hypothetical protein
MELFRPVGLAELVLLFRSEMRAFPPRLPEQPIFYPVLSERYAAQIAAEWNTKADALVGYVTRFVVSDAYGGSFASRTVGSREHQELWVPAEELERFNSEIDGPITVTSAYFGDGFVGQPGAHGALLGLDARAQWAVLARLSRGDEAALAAEITANREAVFANALFWRALSDSDEARSTLTLVRRLWARQERVALPIGSP